MTHNFYYCPPLSNGADVHFYLALYVSMSISYQLTHYYIHIYKLDLYRKNEEAATQILLKLLVHLTKLPRQQQKPKTSQHYATTTRYVPKSQGESNAPKKCRILFYYSCVVFMHGFLFFMYNGRLTSGRVVVVLPTLFVVAHT
jgi:hypothetical protein